MIIGLSMYGGVRPLGGSHVPVAQIGTSPAEWNVSFNVKLIIPFDYKFRPTDLSALRFIPDDSTWRL